MLVKFLNNFNIKIIADKPNSLFFEIQQEEIFENYFEKTQNYLQ